MDKLEAANIEEITKKTRENLDNQESKKNQPDPDISKRCSLKVDKLEATNIEELAEKLKKDQAKKLKKVLDDQKSNKNSRMKAVLIYAYNGTGKTRLAKEFQKDLVSLVFDAYFEDLFFWDNHYIIEDNYPSTPDTNKSPQLRYHSWNALFGFRSIHMLVLQEIPALINNNYLIKYNLEFNVKQVNAEVIGLPPVGNRIQLPTIKSIGFEFQDKNNKPYKISRGEERIFVWCVFLSMWENWLNNISSEKSNPTSYEDRIKKLDNWNKEYTSIYKNQQIPPQYDKRGSKQSDIEASANHMSTLLGSIQAPIFIDDPISSLDDNNILTTVSILADLIKQSLKLDIPVIFTSHHSFFFNRLQLALDKNQVSYFLEKNEASYTLTKSKKPVYHHIHLLKNLKMSSHKKYTKIHCNMMRQLLELLATFSGKKTKALLQELLVEDTATNEFNKQLFQFLNTYSHIDNFDFSDSRLNSAESKLLKKIFDAIQAKYRFELE